MSLNRLHVLFIALILFLILPCIALAGSPSSWGSMVFSQPITITHGVGYNGADVSSIRTPGYGASGYTAARFPSFYFAVADDFKLSEITSLKGVAFYTLQIGNNGDHAAPPTEAFAAIYDKSPALGGNIIWGDLFENILYDVEPINVYRVYETNLLDYSYPMSIIYLNLDITLSPGTYWIEFLAGAPASWGGPYVPLTYAYQTPNILNFNALQDRTSFGGEWVTISEAGEFEPSALIFDLYGKIVSIPKTGDSIVTRLYIPLLLTVFIGSIFALLLIRRFRHSRSH